jgi:hypothetical protein
LPLHSTVFAAPRRPQRPRKLLAGGFALRNRFGGRHRRASLSMTKTATALETLSVGGSTGWPPLNRPMHLF